MFEWVHGGGVWTVIVVFIVVSPGQDFGVTSKGLSWVNKPGEFLCMKDTDASFNWTYTAMDQVTIYYNYKGTSDHPESTYILGYNNNSTYIPVGKRDTRLEFSSVAGSAVISLKNVTAADDGDYECKVVRLTKAADGEKQYLDDVATLTVVSGNELNIAVSIDGTKFALCVADNGTDVTLPGGTVTLPAVMDIRVNVDSKAPQPHRIGVQNRLGDHIFNDHSCSQGYTCNKPMQFGMNLPSSRPADIVITIDFNIQNLDNIHISKSVELEREPVATSRLAPVVTSPPVGTDTAVNPESSLTTDAAKTFTLRGTSQIIVIVLVPVIALVTAAIVIAVCMKKRKLHKSPKGKSSAEAGTDEEETTHFLNPHSAKKPINISASDINKHAICDNLPVAEYIFEFGLDALMHPDSFNESNQAMCELVACLTALLNTSGGIVRLKNTLESTDIKSWPKRFHKYVTIQCKVIPAQVFRKCVRISKIESSGCILVAKSQQPTTFNYHTLSRDVNGCREATDYGTIKQILTQAHEGPDLDFTVMELDQTDKQQVAFLPDKNPDTLLKEITSFQNTPGGGYIVLPDELCKDRTEVKITKELQKMLVGANNQQISVLKQGECWTVTQVPISSQGHRHRSKDSEQVRWALRVEQRPGGAFLRTPECFVISDTGRVESLTFDFWKHYMVNGTSHMLQGRNNDVISGTPAEDETDWAPYGRQGPSTKLELLVDACSVSIHMPTIKETDLYDERSPVEGDTLYPDATATHNWTSTETWKADNCLATSAAPVLNIDQDSRFTMFEMSEPLRCTPKQEILHDLLSAKDQTIASAVDELCSANRGWLVAFPSILKAFDHRPTVQVPSGLLMDLLVAIEGEPLKLAPVLRTKCTKDIKEYGLAAARLLKKYVIHEEHDIKQITQMHIEVSCICGDEVTELEDLHLQRDLNEFFTWRARSNSAHRSLANVFLTSQMYVKNLLVEDMMFHRMSADQDDVLKTLSKFSHVLVEGAPGTGKSWVAKKYSLGMSQQYMSESGSNVVYVCPSQAVCDRFTSEGACTVHLANTWTALKGISETPRQVVTLDDAHNFPNWTPYQWDGFFEKLQTKHLAIFLDNIIKHKDTQRDATNLIPSFVKHCMKHDIPYKTCKMAKAHRASSIIDSFVKSRWSGLMRVMQEDYFHDVPHISGDDVHLHILPESQERHDNELREFVVDLTDDILRQSQTLESSYIYEPRNIAVVIDTAKSRKFSNKDIDELVCTFNRRQVKYNIHKASKHPADGVIVDSLENFQGLEAKILIFVIHHEMGYDQLQHLSDSHYVISIASRASRRLDFVYQGPKGNKVRDLLGFTSGDAET